jgi:hypothetical protein
MGFQHLTYDGARKDVNRYFHEVKMTNVNRVDQFNAWIVEGTCNFHQVKSIGLDKISLHVWNLSCFCRFYFEGGDGPYENEAYVLPFNFIHLEPCNAYDA